jgi:6-phosphogluconolactonase (cycloisomerase 2 family)
MNQSLIFLLSNSFKRFIYFSIAFLAIGVSAQAQTGAALNFDGNNDYVRFPNNTPSWDFGNTFTIEIWIKPNTTASQEILYTGNCNNSCPEWALTIGAEQACSTGGTAGHVVFFGSFAGNKRIVESDNVVSTSAWTHVAVTYNGSNLYMYINGVLQTSTVAVTGTIAQSPWRFIGADPAVSGGCILRWPYKGQIDEFRIWNVARTIAEIQAEMNHEIPTTSPGLVSNYHFNAGTAGGSNSGKTSLLNATSTDYTGTLVNFALTGATSNWVAPGAVASSPPTITSFSPLIGNVGSTVTIIGTNFNTTPANNVVFFGATIATVTASTTTSVTLTVPPGATYAPITLLNTGISLAAYSLSNFTPTYSPAKTTITATDFLAKQDFTTGTQPISVAIGDLDGDGKPDLAVANYNSNTVSVYRNTSNSGSIGAGSFAAKQDFTTGTRPYSVAIGDLDGDGKPDLTVTNSGSSYVSVLRNTSSSGIIDAGSFAAKQDFTTGTTPFSVAIGDLDGDGKPDLAVANLNSNTVSVYRNISSSGNIGAGSFATKQDFTTGTTPFSVAIGDLDKDGKPDLVVANANSQTVSVFRNTSISGSIGASSFAAKQDFTTGASPYSVAIGDLDGDGKLDLAVANYGSSTVSVFHNTSSSGSIDAGSLAAKQDFTTGPDPYSVAIGDLDGDGKPDLAVANINSNTVSVFRNTSSSGSMDAGSFAAKQDFTTGLDPRSVAIGDLDGDGKPDLAVANYGSITISVLRNADITTLPVTLLSYDAKLNSDGTVKLNWITASETNNSYFEILRSTNGIDFTSIGNVTGAGNSTQELRYALTDKAPLAGDNYYQLVQYDKDGKKTDLGIRTVKVSLKATEVLIYPNPSSSLVNINFEANTYNKVELIDLSGKILIIKTIGKQASTISLDISEFAAGTYNVRLMGEGGLVTKQIVKQ